MSLRYFAGYSLLRLSRFLRKVLWVIQRVASLPGKFAMIVWTSREIDRYSRAHWNRSERVGVYSRLEDWSDSTEMALVAKYLTNDGGELLNLACGAGREALLLARRGLRVTGCDWSPRMITAAQCQAQKANLPIRFEVADLYDLQYPANAFDYLLGTNISYSYLMPRRRRIRFLRQAYSFLKPGGLFILSFTPARNGSDGRHGFSQSLFVRLRQCPLFNREYEPGDRLLGESFFHVFQPEALKQEFEEAQFIIKEWLWHKGYAVLTKP